MKKFNFVAAALAFSTLLMPVRSAAQKDSLTTAFFEKNGVAPRNSAKLRTSVFDRTISIKELNSGTIERVYYGYGAKRIDATGTKTKYHIRAGHIEEEYGGVPRMLMIYDWHGRAYICVDNVGDLDEIGDAAGTCPYEVVATAQGNHMREK
jgi:hypothetical protein